MAGNEGAIARRGEASAQGQSATPGRMWTVPLEDVPSKVRLYIQSDETEHFMTRSFVIETALAEVLQTAVREQVVTRGL
jgi:hypothetical protein